MPAFRPILEEEDADCTTNKKVSGTSSTHPRSRSTRASYQAYRCRDCPRPSRSRRRTGSCHAGERTNSRCSRAEAQRDVARRFRPHRPRQPSPGRAALLSPLSSCHRLAVTSDPCDGKRIAISSSSCRGNDRGWQARACRLALSTIIQHLELRLLCRSLAAHRSRSRSAAASFVNQS